LPENLLVWDFAIRIFIEAFASSSTMTRTYVKQVRVEDTNFKNAEALIDEVILKETNGKATFKGIASHCDQGLHIYTLVFERM
jgi:hypothetical protein